MSVLEAVTRARILGGIGGVLGVLTAGGILAIAFANGDTPYAVVDASLLAAAAGLGLWGVAMAPSDVRRASLMMVFGGGAGFFVVGIVWLFAGGLLITGALMLRKEFSV